MKAHSHHFDVDQRNPTSRVVCLDCGFCVPTDALKMKGNLEAWKARQNATDAALQLIGYAREVK